MFAQQFVQSKQRGYVQRKPAAFPVRKYAVRNADNLFSHSLLLALFLSSRYLRIVPSSPPSVSEHRREHDPKGKQWEMLVCVCSEDISLLCFLVREVCLQAQGFFSPPSSSVPSGYLVLPPFSPSLFKSVGGREFAKCRFQKHLPIP